MGSFKQSLVENISLQRCNCNIRELTDTVALFAKEAGFFRFRVFFRASFLQNEVGDPPFFYISDITSSSSFNGKICREKSILQNFRANVLNLFTAAFWHIFRRFLILIRLHDAWTTYGRRTNVFLLRLPNFFSMCLDSVKKKLPLCYKHVIAMSFRKIKEKYY